MRSERDGGQLRRYLLGAASDEECEAIEREYFEHAEALNEVSAAEDDLIDDYLSDRLEGDEDKRFERYLSSPRHRRRVAVARAIRDAASARSIQARKPARSWWAAAGIAAALVTAFAGGSWLLHSRSISRTTSDKTPATAANPPKSSLPTSGAADRREPGQAVPGPAAPTTSPAQPIIVATAISPILVRGGDEPASLAIEAGTDIVRLVLEGQTGEQRLGTGRAIVRTVSGHEVWQGRVARTAGLRPPELARVDIPAALLPPDDYIVELRETGASGSDVERYRYFLRVRSP